MGTMGIREAATLAYENETAARAAEEAADRAKTEAQMYERREQRRRAGEAALAEIYKQVDPDIPPWAELVGFSDTLEWLPAHAVAFIADDLLWVWEDRTSLRVNLPGNEWNTAAGPGILRLYTRCQSCDTPLEAMVVIDLASVGEFLALPAVVAHEVHIDDDPTLPRVLCNATEQQVAEARFGFLERHNTQMANEERHIITTTERRALDLLLDLRAAVYDLDGERQPF